MSHKTISYSVVFTSSALLVLLFIIFQRGGMESVINFGREPQSVNYKYNPQDYVGSALAMAKRDKLFNSVLIENRNENIKIVLNSSDKMALCQVFDKTSLEFEADGVVVDGESPSIKITGICSSEVYLIPITKVLSHKSIDAEINFLPLNIQLVTNNMPPQWPRKWVLKKLVYMSSGGDSANLEIPFYEQGMGRRPQIVMRW